MNQALLRLLQKKEYDYITIKEICQTAGVDRSTFYLHYENVAELLEETVQNVNREFFASFSENSELVSSDGSAVKKDGLYHARIFAAVSGDRKAKQKNIQTYLRKKHAVSG